MVNQSDLPFRTLTNKYGATITYTQMLQPDRLLNDPDYFQFHQRDLTMRPLDHQVVVQLCGNESALVVEAAKKIQQYCDGIDLNLGCPQEAARDGHYGAYLLGERDWPVVEDIVSALSHSVSVPISAKLRLCQPMDKTSVLAQRLEAQGASWITLHPRTVSARRRRNGPADLPQVKILKDCLSHNLKLTGADGIMIGEPLLDNPCLFSTDCIPDPVEISLEYLALCREYPDTASFASIQTHVRHFVDYQCGRRPWFNKFRAALTACQCIDEIEKLFRTKVEKWRGKAVRDSDDLGLDLLS
ncbi:FMN-linked oxidoreductase [Hymenopellis radicata]|nr:FMN-linked oxidoreductase [Hymenopellis radicata]